MDWTSWKKANPINGKIVILCNKSLKESFIGYYNSAMNCYFDNNGNGVRVSHWMPLPEPPKNESN